MATTFVTGNIPLPPDKANGSPVPVGAENLYGRAEDFNFLRDAVGDLRDHTRGWANARSYGLACDGVTDDYPALAAMLTLLGSTPATLIVPGPCLVGTSIAIPATLPVRFEGAGAFTGAGTVTFTRWGAGASGGGGVGGGGSLFTVTPRQSKTWTLADMTQAQFSGVGVTGPSVFGAGSRSAISGADRQWLQCTLPTTANSSSGIFCAQAWARPTFLPKISTRIHINQLTNGATFFTLSPPAGNSLLNYAPTAGNHADTAPVIAISYDSRAGANFMFGSGDGVTASWVDSGVTANTADDWLLVIEFVSASSIKFTVTNCSTGAAASITKTTNLPSSTQGLVPNLGAFNFVAAANIGPYFEYVYLEHN